MEVPANLITTSWNLMQLHKSSASDKAAPPASCQVASQNSTTSGQRVYTRHMQLQDKLLKVRIDSAISADGLSVENEYSKEVGNTEMSRYRALNSCPDETVKSTINNYYDKERLQLANKTEEKLDLLINKAESMRQAAMMANKQSECPKIIPQTDSQAIQGRLSTQDTASQGASLLLQPISESDKMNAVRKLKFNISDDHVDQDDEDNDYLNGSVNSEDFEIDEIDVETVDQEISEAIPEDRTARIAQELPIPSPATSTGSDLLQQCIEESGLNVETITRSVPSCDSDESVGGTSDCGQPPYSNVSTRADVQPIFTPKSTISSHRNDSFYGNNPTSISREEPIKSSIQHQAFGTPKNFDFMFTQPDRLNIALSEIGKLCGGPSVTFTPELRREASAFTPQPPGFSPFSSVSNNMTSGYVPVKPYADARHFNSSQWTSPAGTQPSLNSETGTQSSFHQYGSGQKRKRECDDDDDDSNSVTTETPQPSPVSHHDVSSASDHGDLPLLNNPQFKTHRMLTAEATTVLSQWYTAHVHYPYPNDEEVKQLSELTGITGRQVKKWMANKRVRCFNTLSITGNQHPIKFKYNGKGRKKKPATLKENCHSTTHDKKANYSLLSDDAKVILNNWYEQNQENPYPSEDQKQQLAEACNISVGQVKSWFANKRNRTNNTRRQVPNYFINKFPEYSGIVQYVGQRREEARLIKRRKVHQMNMYIQPNFYF